MTVASRWQRQQAGKMLLAAALAVLAVVPAASQNASAHDGITTGTAYMSIENYPLPSNFKLINDGVQLQCGPQVISDRVAVEKAGYISQNQTFGPVGAAIRYTTFTAHPFQSPGLENYTCVAYKLYSYATNLEGPASFFTADSLYVVTTQSERYFAQEGFDVQIYLLWTRKLAALSNSTLPLNATTADTADILSHLEISGPNLLPFTYDKQILLVNSIMTTSRMANVPVGLSNVSSWQAAEALKNGTRRLLQSSVDTFSTDVWTELIPINNYTATSLWSGIAPSIKTLSAAAGYPMTVKFRNATVYTRLAGQPLAVISTEPASASGTSISASQSSGGGGLSGGAIAGIVIGAVAGLVLLAALAAFLLLRLRRRQRRQEHKVVLADDKYAVGKDMYGSDGTTGTFSSGGTDGSSLGLHPASVRTTSNSSTKSSAGSIAISPKDVEICHHPDGRAWILGSGNFGRVYKGLWRGHHEVAVKQLTCFADDMLLSALRKEIGILKRVSFNRNIVQFYGFCLDESAPMLVMELMEGGDLRRALWKNEGNEYAWDRRGAQVALDVARGLHFLHSSGVIHRDIKTSNVLLTREGVAKIADVGLAITADYFSAGSATGTFSYAAPELLMGGKCSPKVDSYSFGVVLWEIITKQPPQRGHLREVKDEEAPPAIQKLLEDCINTEVSQRPSAAEIVERLQAAVPSLATSSSRSLSSVISGSGASAHAAPQPAPADGGAEGAAAASDGLAAAGGGAAAASAGGDAS